MSKDVYYLPQDDWNSENFFYLHRCLHRIFFYDTKHTEEIKNMDTARMTAATRVLIYCIIKYYGKEYLFEQYENLRALEKTEPLKKVLVIDDEPLPEDNVYKQMNVRY